METKPTPVSYEAFAPRTSEQIKRLQRIQALSSGPYFLETPNEDDVHDWKFSEALIPPIIPPGNNMITSTECANVKEILDKALHTSDHVSAVLKHSTSLRLALRASINICEDISNRHAELLRHSGELSAAADRLQAEESQLTQHAKEIGLPLQHYDAVDRIGILVGVLFRGKTTVRGLAKVKVDHDEYPEILDEIDQAMEYFGIECGGKEALMAAERSKEAILKGSMEYYRRSIALQEAALFLVHEAVVDRISQTSSDIMNALNLRQKPLAAEKLEASLIYTRFHGISARSNRLIRLIKTRKGDAYYDLLLLCRTTYCFSREGLMKTTIRAHMDSLRDQHGLIGMTRIASVFLIRLCAIETQLYLDFFGDPNQQEAIDNEFQSFLNNLCQSLHRTVRRGLVTVHDLDTLCQIVSVLREERGQASSSSITMAAARSISSVIEDAQERLIFCANSVLQREVTRFRATPADLDYPEKLKEKVHSTTVDENEDAVHKQLQIYEGWFPPIRSVLKVLSKIFRVVEPRVFEDIARDAVHECTRSLKEGASFILQKSGVVHADLFLVKHLLVSFL
jgi:conserved oligomeric Golgi complex subunit 3